MKTLKKEKKAAKAELKAAQDSAKVKFKEAQQAGKAVLKAAQDSAKVALKAAQDGPKLGLKNAQAALDAAVNEAETERAKHKSSKVRGSLPHPISCRHRSGAAVPLPLCELRLCPFKPLETDPTQIVSRCLLADCGVSLPAS